MKKTMSTWSHGADGIADILDRYDYRPIAPESQPGILENTFKLKACEEMKKDVGTILSKL